MIPLTFLVTPIRLYLDENKCMILSEPVCNYDQQNLEFWDWIPPLQNYAA
jgi:hypothetical protein